MFVLAARMYPSHGGGIRIADLLAERTRGVQPCAIMGCPSLFRVLPYFKLVRSCRVTGGRQPPQKHRLSRKGLRCSAPHFSDYYSSSVNTLLATIIVTFVALQGCPTMLTWLSLHWLFKRPPKNSQIVNASAARGALNSECKVAGTRIRAMLDAFVDGFPALLSTILTGAYRPSASMVVSWANSRRWWLQFLGRSASPPPAGPHLNALEA